MLGFDIFLEPNIRVSIIFAMFKLCHNFGWLYIRERERERERERDKLLEYLEVKR